MPSNLNIKRNHSSISAHDIPDEDDPRQSHICSMPHEIRWKKRRVATVYLLKAYMRQMHLATFLKWVCVMRLAAPKGS